MSLNATIYILKTSKGLRQCKYRTLVIGEFSTQEEAKTFSINYPNWSRIQIWDGETMVEEVLP